MLSFKKMTYTQEQIKAGMNDTDAFISLACDKSYLDGYFTVEDLKRIIRFMEEKEK